MRRISIGIDIAKDIRWATAIDADGIVLLSRNCPTVRQISQPSPRISPPLAASRASASTSSAAWQASSRRRWPRPASCSSTSRASPSTAPAQGTTGGEDKSDPRDTHTIATLQADVPQIAHREGITSMRLSGQKVVVTRAAGVHGRELAGAGVPVLPERAGAAAPCSSVQQTRGRAARRPACPAGASTIVRRGLRGHPSRA